MIALYVYFRARAEDDAAVAAALDRLGASLESAGFAAPGLWRRPDLRDGLRTWMEVHPPVPAGREDALRAALDDAVARAGLVPLVDGARHVERFEPAGG